MASYYVLFSQLENNKINSYLDIALWCDIHCIFITRSDVPWAVYLDPRLEIVKITWDWLLFIAYDIIHVIDQRLKNDSDFSKLFPIPVFVTLSLSMNIIIELEWIKSLTDKVFTENNLFQQSLYLLDRAGEFPWKYTNIDCVSLMQNKNRCLLIEWDFEILLPLIHLFYILTVCIPCVKG